ncbi:MAG TPA: CoA ester lyase [Candidatus Dormibacteraeota bacterium]|nr:CoA ester lyase [Candidatus Dormibacteraeota bacterium]
MADPARRVRSWLFAPGHDSKLLTRVFDCGADEVLLDLEDAVPPHMKARARQMVAEVAAARRCWVRVNRPATDECARDLVALEGKVAGLRLPKVESASEVAWVASRAPGVPLDCTIESARGVLNAYELASAPGCALLSYGGIDLAVDLGIGRDEARLDYAKSAMAIAARAAGKPPPSDGIHPRLQDDEGLRLECEAARRLGFFGKSAIHPRQVPIINEAFSPTSSELAWAERVLAAFEASGGAATRLADGEFVDLPVAERARLIKSQLRADS